MTYLFQTPSESGPVRRDHPKRDWFWRHYPPIPTGRVVRITDEAVAIEEELDIGSLLDETGVNLLTETGTTSVKEQTGEGFDQNLHLANGDTVFMGGRIYEIDDATAQILIDAGYTPSSLSEFLELEEGGGLSLEDDTPLDLE